jgi:hypothetical protein
MRSNLGRIGVLAILSGRQCGYSLGNLPNDLFWVGISTRRRQRQASDCLHDHTLNLGRIGVTPRRCRRQCCHGLGYHPLDHRRVSVASSSAGGKAATASATMRSINGRRQHPYHPQAREAPQIASRPGRPQAAP